MNTLNIAIIHGNFNTFGGAERIIFQLIEALLLKNHNVTLITYSISTKLKQQLKTTNCKTIELKTPIININDTKIGSLRFLGWKIRSKLKQYDIINVHNFPATLWLGFAANVNPELLNKVIWSCHEPPRFLYEDKTPSTKIKKLQMLDKKVVNKFYKVICNSHYTASLVKNYYNITPKVKHFGIIYPKKFNPIKKETNITYFGIVSRLEPIKNISFVLKAISSLKATSPQTKLSIDIIGTGSEEKTLKKLCNKLNLNTSVNFKGFIDDKVLTKYYQKWHAVIFCPFKEPMGLIPLEAACYNTPTIGSNMGGLLETIINNETGILIDPKNQKNLITAIKRICNDKVFASKLGIQANKHVQNNFNFENTVIEFEKEFLAAYETFKTP